MTRKALLLSNIGSPDAPETPAVRRYLREFLMDPDVITLPWPARWLLVNGIIAPFRAASSAKKYREIWTPQGSPLLLHSHTFAEAVTSALGPEWVVRTPMRYGTPGFADIVREIQGLGDVEEVILAPMFPQETPSTTGSSVKALRRELAKAGYRGRVSLLPGFHHTQEFLKPLAASLREVGGTEFQPDFWLFSFHGLPESHLRIPGNTYREQCEATAHALARELGLERERWGFSFQSRLGPTKWIGPHTDETLRALPGRGIRKLAVAAPSFVADCLETLEEISLQGRGIFLEAGGTGFQYLPCLNSRPDWVSGFAALLKKQGFPRQISGN